ncbi:MAG TPA: hypothetical protein VNT75_09575 [Symbiobacteriaceae bacterium]|nr:hypothetical protein [Symbiobacteriaceae bacterium]
MQRDLEVRSARGTLCTVIRMGTKVRIRDFAPEGRVWIEGLAMELMADAFLRTAKLIESDHRHR